MVRKPLLSIVVTSYTTERLDDIYELLDGIKLQTYPDIETIFIVERSRELEARVRVYSQKESITDLQVLYNDGEQGLSASRNLGIEHAKGDIVAFVDDDVILFPDWAEQLVKTYDDESIIGVTGSAFPRWEDESMAWLPEEFYWVVSCTGWYGGERNDRVREVRNAWGMNMSFRKKVFDSGISFASAYGLHDSQQKSGPDPPSEDVDLSFRAKRLMKGRILYAPTAVVYHRVYRWRLSTKFIVQRAYSVGYQRRMLKKLYSEVERNPNILQQEYGLLRRILFSLLPRTSWQLFTSPIIAVKKFWISFLVLFFVALGYTVPFEIPLPAVSKAD